MTLTINKGFIADIYENKEIGNCSNRGISYWCKQVTIVTEIENLQIFDIDPRSELRRPLVVIKKKGNYIYAEPIDKPKGIGWMMGGSYIFSSDSRFRRLLNEYPIPLHDRQETPEEYDVLSR